MTYIPVTAMNRYISISTIFVTSVGVVGAEYLIRISQFKSWTMSALMTEFFRGFPQPPK